MTGRTTSKAGLATIGAILGLPVASAPALATGNGIKLSAPSSLNYGSSITFTVSGHGSRIRGICHDYPPNMVIVTALTSPSAHCPGTAGNVEQVLRFHSKKVSQVLRHFSRTRTVTPSSEAYGLCAVLLNFPAGHRYARTAAYFTVQGHALGPYTLTASVAGRGAGEVTGYSDADNGDSIDCNPFEGITMCSHSYPAGTIVHLAATGLGGTCAGWSGDCSGTDMNCDVTMNSNKTVTATFNAG